MSRRLDALALLLLIPLAGCSSNSGSDWSSVYAMVQDYWKGTPPISLEQAAAVPFASIGVRIGDGAQVLLVLATQDDTDLMWVAGHTVAIETVGGRIVKTSGLDRNLTRLSSNRATDGQAGAWTQPAASTWMADFADDNRYAVQLSCNRLAPVSDPVTILGKEIATVRVDETCEAPALDWSFTNSFWVEPASGFVWRSVQHVSPNLDPIEIVVLRPPEH